jgi:hypothetical protein
MRSLYIVAAGGQGSRRAQRHIFLSYWGAFSLSTDLTLGDPLPNDSLYRHHVTENEEIKC